MKNKQKFGILLGTFAAAAVPLTVVACNNKKKPSVSTIPNKPIDFSQAYSVEKLKKEALEINHNKPWDQRALWKNGFLYESITQAVSMMMNVAEGFGYDQATSLNKNGSDKNDDFKPMFVIDGNNDDKSKTDEQLLAEHGINQGTENYDLILGDTHFLRSISSIEQPITDADHLNVFSMAAVNQTVDSRSDLSRSHLQTSFSDEDLAGFDGQINIFPWANQNEKGGMNVIYTRRYSSSRVAIKFSESDVAGIYPTIDQNTFVNEYTPYIKEAFSDFIKKIGSLLSGADSVYDTPAGSFLSRTVMDLFDFFLKNDFVRTDSNGNYYTNFEDSKLLAVLNKLNANGSINWLAIKGLVFGYDESFSTEGYEQWNNSNWDSAVAENHNNPTGMVGIRDDSFRLDAGSDDTSGLTPWMHGGKMLNFNPSISVQDNWALNGQVFDPNKYPSIEAKKQKFNELVDSFQKSIPADGITITGDHYLPASKTFKQNQLLALGIQGLPTGGDVEYSDVKVIDYQPTDPFVTISMKMRNIHLISEDQSQTIQFKVIGINSSASVDDAKTQVDALRQPLLKRDFEPSSTSWNTFVNSYAGAGIKLDAGSHLNLANIKAIWSLDGDKYEVSSTLDLSKIGNVLDNDQSLQLLDIFNPYGSFSITQEDISKIDLTLTVKEVNPATGEVTFDANIYPKGNATSVAEFDLKIKLPLIGS